MLGGGYVGIEMAQAYRRFGSRVTVIEPGPQIVSREDADAADAVQRLLSEEGVAFLASSQVLKVDGRSGRKVTVTVRSAAGERRIEGSDILVAAGRIPNTTGIGLEKAGIELDNHGYIRVNERLQTTAPDVWPSANARAARSSPTSRSTTFVSSGTTWPAASAARAIGWCRVVCSPIRRLPMSD